MLLPFRWYDDRRIGPFGRPRQGWDSYDYGLEPIVEDRPTLRLSSLVEPVAQPFPFEATQPPDGPFFGSQQARPTTRPAQQFTRRGALPGEVTTRNDRLVDELCVGTLIVMPCLLCMHDSRTAVVGIPHRAL